MGIDHPLIASDDELVALVTYLHQLGIPLADMVGADLAFIGGPKMIRPDATIDPSDAFVDDEHQAFRSRAAVALGFNIDEEDRLLTPAEVETIEFFEAMHDVLGEEDMLALMRVMGSTMGRLARSIISALRLRFEVPLLEETGNLASVAVAYQEMSDDQLTPFLDTMATVLRRHLAVAASIPTQWGVDRSHSATIERLTVGFVDMVGFTSFTEQANLREFIDALTSFESQANDIIITNGGTLVKLIGDAVMFVAPTPASGVEIARRLAQLTIAEGGPMSVRIGLSAGQVAAVGGDYYGTVVNTAARAVQHADPDAIVATAQVAKGAHASAQWIAIGARELRGISEPVELFQLA